MKVSSELEVEHFIKYLNKFDNLSIVNKKFDSYVWNISLNDGATYVIHNILWELIQDNVPRLSAGKQVIQ